MTERYAGPAREQMSEAQAAVYDEIARTRPRTGVRGPFRPWLANPGLADGAQRLGRVCRFETSLGQPLTEVVILTVATHHSSEVERKIHEEEARTVGVPEAIILALANNEQSPPFDAADEAEAPRLRVAHAFTRELVATSHVGDESYAAAVAALGETGVVEVIGLVGYYSLVAYTLNALRLTDG
ncbi:carboxymuconolactone decarboxylase [Pavlovales sp. CCMP2436]|nr:carboxymuconolactone decarboxylase [Pavlovales sp. CCMP2436]|mmetsp:Transcript_15252/g.38654  ORF Transcript_15252/g.38654 Transcript_15252/m.38654 type:complete len:184 (-) Transcript_15252:199-750(-)